MRLLLTLCLSLAIGGCAGLPRDVARPPSTARTDVAATALAGIAATSTPEAAGGLSGFRLLPDGGRSFDARLALIRRAEATLDVQYYLIASDRSGLQFLAALAEAAARGVRVRVLVDDLSLVDQDGLFAGHARRPGFEVRVFNPLPARRGGFVARLVFSLHHFPRINHRMHSKLLVADNSFAITGGRNIGDAYFDRSASAHNFIDMDLLATGPVVRALSEGFDDFWNSGLAYPIASLAGAARGDESDGAAPASAGPAPAPAPDGSVPGGGFDLDAQLEAGRVALHFAPARVLADGVGQVEAGTVARGDSVVMRGHLDLLRSAEASALVASPYFVPGAGGLQALREVRGRDVRLTVMTNSRSTTDEPLAHFGYARYRAALLRLGVALHELMPNAAQGSAESTVGHRSLGRLHAKLVVVDRRWLSIGSMNMDRRSSLCNSETAVVIDSPALAAEAEAFLARGRLAGSYRLRLADNGRDIEWLGEGGATLRREPPAAGGRLASRLASFFVSEDWL